MRTTILNRDALAITISEPCFQRLPCMRHCANDGMAGFVGQIITPKVSDLLTLSSRYLCIDCWRKEISLARVIGSE